MKKKKSIMITLFIICSVMMFSTGIAQEKSTSQVTVEKNINRPGKDYKNVVLPKADPNQCARLCENDPKCKAYTYVKPGVQGKKAVCWLKNEVPEPVKDNNCISGVSNQFIKQIAKVRRIETIPKTIDQDKDKLDIPKKMKLAKKELPATRSEVLGKALKIEIIRNKLIDITKSRGVNLNSLNTQTLSGKIAIPNVNTAEIIETEGNKNSDGQNYPEGQGVSIWSGGIQLTPNNLFSRKFYHVGNNIESYAYIRISGIKTGYQIYNWQGIGLEEMANSNMAIIDNSRGMIDITLKLDEDLATYIFTVALESSIPSPNSIKLIIGTVDPAGGIVIELFPSSDNSEYVGIGSFSGFTYGYIDFKNSGPWPSGVPTWYFRGITITKI